MSANLDNSTATPAPRRWTPGPRLRATGTLIGAPAWVLFSMFGLAGAVLSLVFMLFPPLDIASKTIVGQLVGNTAIYAVAVFFVLLPLIARKKVAEIATFLGLYKKPTFSGVGWAIVAFVIYFWTTIVVSLIVAQIPGFNAQQEQNVGFTDVTTVLEYVMAFIGLVVLPPIFEETLFRGYLFGRLRQHVGFWFSTLVTSAVFGFVHGQWNVGIDTFVLSIFLCVLREYTGSLWASMILHALKNGLAYFFLFIGPLIGLNLL